MAELVQYHLESTIPELEEMERVGLFTRAEIQKLIKQRRVFEYRLQKHPKKKEDFVKYIEFEINLLSLIGKRRERLLYDFKKNEIDFAIAARINSLFKGVISRFQNDVALWLNQIQFCKRMNWHTSISTLYTKMLQVHSLSPPLWVLAAKWEMEENNSPENARLLLQKGLRFNKESDVLWREYFRMELMYSDLLHKRRKTLGLNEERVSASENTDAVLEGKVAIVVYDNATKAISDVNFALSFLQICQDFTFTQNHIDHIFDELMIRHSDKEETFDAFAKRPLLSLNAEIKQGKEMGIKKKNVIQKLHNEVCSRYEDAVKKLQTEKMWSYYIEFHLSHLKTAKKEARKLKLLSGLLQLMQRAAESDCLCYNHYFEWVQLLEDSGSRESAAAISLAAAQKYKKLSLWLLCLALHVQMQKSQMEVFKLFNEALNSIKEKDSYLLWKLGVDYLSLTEPSKLLSFFEKGIKSCKEVSVPMKEMYLEATALKEGIKPARDLYQELKKMYPISPELFMKMIVIEYAQIRPSIKWLRRYYEDALREYGSTNVDFWINYMKMEVEHPGGNPAAYGVLYSKAMKSLEAHLTTEFVARITLYATGHGHSENWELMA